MIILGLILLICGLVFGVPLAIAGGVGPGIGGRRFWY